MAEPGSRTPASDYTEAENMSRLRREGLPIGRRQSMLSDQLRQELALKGLKGFKKGGKVKKTGLAKVHKGERVLTAKQAKAHAKTPSKRSSTKRAAPKRRIR